MHDRPHRRLHDRALDRSMDLAMDRTLEHSLEQFHCLSSEPRTSVRAAPLRSKRFRNPPDRYTKTHRTVSSRRNALTLKELLFVFAILGGVAVIATVLMPNIIICREPSTRLVCAANLKGIGTSMQIYANDNGEEWAGPQFDETRIGQIDYTVSVGGGTGSVRSPDRTQPSFGGDGGARQLSATRSFWMLVRSGDLVPPHFICPRSGDSVDATEQIELYYDFTSNKNVSYGFQVPFGPNATRAFDGRDNRMALAADKGPYVDASVKVPPASLAPARSWASYGRDGTAATDRASALRAWRPFNSPNHGGEGQNVLYADGHVSFVRTPTVGVDNDNIYTVALDNWTLAGRTSGESPWKRSAHPYVYNHPQSGASSTDSVIFP